jgi:TPP-dependent pyruvate/acetoin dehydrogenase alpha subunit
VVTTVGDGSTSLGDFHETLNFIALRRLPVVVVIVNNQYAYATPTTLQYATERLSDRAAGYGMVGETIDGTDVVRVIEAVGSALDRGRRGHGPTLLEARTMRMRGHSEHDDFKYVPPELLDAWNRWDPVARLRQAIIDRDRSDAAALDALEERVTAEVARAFEQALGEPEPSVERAEADVYRAWSSDWTAPSGSSWALPEDTPWRE